jgi:hypothetical protein
MVYLHEGFFGRWFFSCAHHGVSPGGMPCFFHAVQLNMPEAVWADVLMPDKVVRMGQRVQGLW